MQIFSTYSVKIKHYNSIFKDTVSAYRKVTDFLIDVCLKEWDSIHMLDGSLNRQSFVESLCHKTKNNPAPKYGKFDQKFYKLPSYVRRAAITEAIGKVSSYQSNLSNWEGEDIETRGRKPSFPRAGFSYPCMYKDNMFIQTGKYTARLKVRIRNTWDWIEVELRKSDIDYINHHCRDR